MKAYLYLLTALLAIFLVSCTGETPTNINIESLNRKPVTPPPDTKLPSLLQNTKYVAGYAGGQIFVWENNSRIWTRQAGTISGIGIGNFSGDDSRELLVTRKATTGKGQTTIQLLMFDKNNLEPLIFNLRSYIGFKDAVWDMKTGDVDGDGAMEVVIAFRDFLEIWEYNGTSFIKAASWNYYTVSGSPNRISFGNLDSDQTNEILVSFSGPLWRAYKFTGNSLTLLVQSSAFPGNGNLNCAKISDVDNDGLPEVIGGSFESAVLIWESPYTGQGDITARVFTGMPWAAGVGELDGSLTNGKEIVAGGYNMDGLHLLHYSSGVFQDELKVSGIIAQVDGVIIEDISSSQGVEIVVAASGCLKVFNSSFTQIFTDPAGDLENIICQ